MLRTPDIVRRITMENPLLLFGLQHRLFNLSQLAAYIAPQVAVRAKKEVSASAILMALSRLQRQMGKIALRRDRFAVTRLDIQTGLVTYTFPKTAAVQRAVQKLHGSLESGTNRITMTEGTSQLMLIVDQSMAEAVEKTVPARFLYRHRNISSVGISFDKRYVEFPGMLYIIMQQITLQNINIVEISSTFTEFVLYLDEADTKVAFETLYSLFVSGEGKGERQGS